MEQSRRCQSHHLQRWTQCCWSSGQYEKGEGVLDHSEILREDSFSKTWEWVSRDGSSVLNRFFHSKHSRCGDGKWRGDIERRGRRKNKIWIKAKDQLRAVKVMRNSSSDQTKEQCRDQQLVMEPEGKTIWFHLQQKNSYLTPIVKVQIPFLVFYFINI